MTKSKRLLISFSLVSIFAAMSLSASAEEQTNKKSAPKAQAVQPKGPAAAGHPPMGTAHPMVGSGHPTGGPGGSAAQAQAILVAPSPASPTPN